MIRRAIGVAALCLVLPISGLAQVSDKSRLDIIRALLAEESAARIDMPFGGEGVELSAAGEVDQGKLQKEIQKNGKSIITGRVVRLTAFEFNSKSIEVELDGGGKAKKGIGSRIQVSVGGGGSVQQQPASTPKAIGSKVTLQFANKVPQDLTVDQLKLLLDPVLDFTKKTITSTNVESLPPEFKEAVLAKEARIGMDGDIVILALGRPDRRSTEKVDGVEQETWYYRHGNRTTFVSFENDIVVKVTEQQ